MKYTFSISQNGGSYLVDKEFNNKQDEEDFYNEIAERNEKIIGIQI